MDLSVYGSPYGWRLAHWELATELDREMQGRVAAHDPNQDGIPATKFLSSGDWFVSASEIEGALRKFRDAEPDVRIETEHIEIWQTWLEWLQVTNDHGGFIVS